MKPPKLLQNFIYNPLKIYLRIGLHFFFSSYKVIGRNNVPKTGPIIFAVNHQNAFLDAILVSCSTYRNPYFLARGDVFKHPIANFLLRTIRLLPIYRFRDGIGNVRKNFDSMDACKQILLNNECFIIFPEGNHDSRWNLRILQKGIARIAFETATFSDWQQDIQIVPVGIQYSRNTLAGGTALLSFGEPLALDNFKSEYQNDAKKGQLALMKTLQPLMQKLIVHIDNMDEYEPTAAYLINHLPNNLDVLAEKEWMQDQLKNNALPKESLNNKKPNYLIIGFFALFLQNTLPVLMMRFLVDQKIKDLTFHASLKFTVGMLLVPLSYILFALLLSTIVPISYLASFGIVMLTGLASIKPLLFYLYPYRYQHPKELFPRV